MCDQKVHDQRNNCCCCCPRVEWKKTKCAWEGKKCVRDPTYFKTFKITETLLPTWNKPFQYSARDVKFAQLQAYLGKQDPLADYTKCLNRQKKVMPGKTRTLSALERKFARVKEDITHHKKRPVSSPVNMFRLVGNDYGNAFYRNIYAKWKAERDKWAAAVARNAKKNKTNRGAWNYKGQTCGQDRLNASIWSPIGPKIYKTTMCDKENPKQNVGVTKSSVKAKMCDKEIPKQNKGVAKAHLKAKMCDKQIPKQNEELAKFPLKVAACTKLAQKGKLLQKEGCLC